MFNKRGQFYLIAAIIIAVVISGIATVANYAVVSPKPEAIESMSSDLQQEGPRIVDYGIYSKDDLRRVLTNFTANEFAPYFLKKTENSNVIFIYGNKTNLYGVKYNMTSKGTISASISGGTNWNTASPYAENVSIIPSGNLINVTLLGKTFNFELRENEMFYFVMAQQKQGETYIKKNE